jgi:GT2 family glycosyltransferase
MGGSNPAYDNPTTATRLGADQPIVPSACVPGLVSVIIPVYNRDEQIVEALGSVRLQTYRPIEAIVVDDGSTDDTVSVCRGIAESWRVEPGLELRIVEQLHRGACPARNRGLRESRGEYICYLDSDDVLTRDSISERASLLAEESDVDFCYGSCSVMDDHGQEIERFRNPWPAEGGAAISSCLFYISGPLIRRSTCCKAGFWREDLQGNQDFEYFARIKHCSQRVRFVDKIVFTYMRHNGQHICNESPAYALSFLKSILIVKSLVLYGDHDNTYERDHLALRFRTAARKLYVARAYEGACGALFESLSVRWNMKVFAQWLAVKALAIGRAGNHRHVADQQKVC